MKTSVIVVDDFYSDPDAVRQVALSDNLLQKEALSENFPGFESEYGYFSTELIQKFEQLVGGKILIEEEGNAFGRFRFAQADHKRKTQVHFDGKDWSAVIYLTDVLVANAGTLFFEHKETRLVGPPCTANDLKRSGCNTVAEFDRKFVVPDTLNLEAWDVHLKVPFKYNRLVLFRGNQLFHGSGALFGNSLESARLTHNFFFDEVS